MSGVAVPIASVDRTGWVNTAEMEWRLGENINEVKVGEFLPDFSTCDGKVLEGCDHLELLVESSQLLRVHVRLRGRVTVGGTVGVGSSEQASFVCSS